ncbi:MAG: antiterminator LoaP [Spirochaetes bacterium]|nr:antiterminator LoaP [Spirochaetota bacterium]
MEYYAIQVKTLHEDDFAKVLSLNAGASLSITVPKRALPIRKLGKTVTDVRPVFPGYVFIGISDPETYNEIHWLVKRTKFFYRFLPSNQTRKPLTGFDLRLLTHFISHGERADTSKVKFDENDRIVVLEGPLKGLEGFIVKVDRRKGRAKVRLAMCEDSFSFDLAFTAVELASKGNTPQNGQ